MPAFTVLNPATEEPVAEVEQTSAADADAAIARAVAALAGSLFYGVLAVLERLLTFWHPSYRR